MEKIEHIGIAVEDIEKANSLFKSILGKTHYTIKYPLKRCFLMTS